MLARKPAASVTDTTPPVTPPVEPARADTARIVMHHFNHRQQIITGSVIMACLAAIMTVMNNYNPQVGQ